MLGVRDVEVKVIDELRFNELLFWFFSFVVVSLEIFFIIIVLFCS